MAWFFRYDPERELLIQLIEGNFSLEDLGALRKARREQAVPSRAKRCLNDMRRCTLDFTLGELRKNEFAGGALETGGARTAVLAAEALPTAMTMLWGRMLEGIAEVHVFSTPEAAYAWLGVSQEDGDTAF
jgi:hypothetical protein